MYTIKIYCPNIISGYGGAEGYVLTLASYLSNTYKNIDLSMVIYATTECKECANHENDRPMKNQMREELSKKYNLAFSDELDFIILPESKNNSVISKYCAHTRLRGTSTGTDLYINGFHNVHYFHGRKNIHIIHFPAPPRVQASPFFTKHRFFKPVAAALDSRYRNCYDLFLCNSAFTKKWLEHYWHVNEDLIQILYPPVLILDEKRDSQNRDSINQKEKNILMVSRFDPRKKILELVDFFIENNAHYPEWRLLVAGSTDRRYQSYLDVIEKRAQNNNIYIYKDIAPIELACLYQKSSIFWHAMGLDVDEEKDPLDLEHFGITTVEAMSAGVVPIVINKGGQKEIVDHGINGYRWNNLKELRMYTRAVMLDETLRQSLARAAIEKSKIFSRESFYQHADEIFQRFSLIPEEYRK